MADSNGYSLSVVKPYDVLQIKRSGGDWQDYYTIKTQEEIKVAARRVNVTGYDTAQYRIVDMQGKVVYAKEVK